jgi:hypothetical protein
VAIDGPNSGARKVLLLGPSSFSQPTSDGELLKDRLVRSLNEGSSGAVEAVAERVYFGHGMAARTRDFVDQHNPDAVVLYLGSGPFELESIVQVIGVKWPGAYQRALRLSTRVRSLAGGGMEGAPGPRGWLYRFPRRLLAGAIGVGTRLSLDEAVNSSNETIQFLCQREDIIPLVYFSAISWPPTFTRALALVAEFDRRVRDYCRQRGVQYWYRQEEMARRGFVPRRGRDGYHADFETYEFEAGLITDLVCKELQTGSGLSRALTGG